MNTDDKESIIAQLEKLRSRYIIWNIIKYTIIVFFVLFVMVQNEELLLPIGILGGALLVVIWIPQVFKDKFDKLYKETFSYKIIKEVLGESVQYCYNEGFSESKVCNFGLTKLGNRFESEDLLRATYKNIKFEMSDIEIKKVVKTGKSTSTTVYFDGRMIRIKASIKNIKELTIFSDKYFYRQKCHDMEKVELEDVDFNKRFDVYSADMHEAFYVLTPHFMEKIKKLYDKYESIAIRMYGEYICIGLNGVRDTFNANIYEEIVYEKECELIRSDIRDITELIDALDLTKDYVEQE